MIGSALLINGVPIECINQAALRYYVPAKLIIAVLKTESGRPGLARPNKNGTFDYGPMQINSFWSSKIAPYGYTLKALKSGPCINVEVGTWILAREIAREKNFWKGAGSYHSHTPSYKGRYEKEVHAHYQALEQALNNEN